MKDSQGGGYAGIITHKADEAEQGMNHILDIQGQEGSWYS